MLKFAKVRQKVGKWLAKSGFWDAWLRGDEFSYLPQGDMVDEYRQHVWVYACVNKVARSVASTKLVLYRNDIPISTRMRDGIALTQMFASADPNLSRFHMLERTVGDMLLWGSAFWHKKNNAFGVPVKFQVLLAKYMVPVLKLDGVTLDYWWYGGTTKILPSEVIQFRFVAHDVDWVGLAPLEVSKLVAGTDYKAMIAQKAMFDNGSEPGGILSTDSDYLQEDEVKLIRNQWESRHQGPDRVKKIAVLPKGLKYERVAYSAKEMEYLGLRKFSREDICVAFGVPMAVLGISDNVNYATNRSLKRIMWEDTIVPVMQIIEAQLETSLFQQSYSDISAKFDLGEVIELQRDIPQETTSGVKLFQMGYSRDQINAWMRWGFEPDEFSGEHYIPTNMVLAEQLDVQLDQLENPPTTVGQGPDGPGNGVDGDPGQPVVDPENQQDGTQGGETPEDYNDGGKAFVAELVKRLPSKISRGVFDLRLRVLPDRSKGWTASEMAAVILDRVAPMLGGYTLEAAGVLNEVCSGLATHVNQFSDSEGDVKLAFNMLSNKSSHIAGLICERITRKLSEAGDD